MINVIAIASVLSSSLNLRLNSSRSRVLPPPVPRTLNKKNVNSRQQHNQQQVLTLDKQLEIFRIHLILKQIEHHQGLR